VDRDEAACPTAIAESILATAIIDAKENQDIMVIDIPNAFVQTDMNHSTNNKRIIMKIRGSLVNMLIQINPEKYLFYFSYYCNPGFVKYDRLKLKRKKTQNNNIHAINKNGYQEIQV
jgi:hypothetical protein